MKVYDCFLFNGEFELLEIRLDTHGDVVDKFVIVEGDKTFRGKIKEEIKLSKISPVYADKIIPVVVDVPIFKELDGAWLSMAHFRNNMIRGLAECSPEDCIIFSEMDEIIRPEKIREAVEIVSSGMPSVVFEQDMFCYYLNVKDPAPWGASIMMKFETVLKEKILPQAIRNAERFDDTRVKRLANAGWHFQNLGGPERVRKKLVSSCHHELGAEEYSNIEVVRDKINRLVEPLEREDHKLSVVPIDESYPSFIRNNQEKFAHLIYQGEKNDKT